MPLLRYYDEDDDAEEEDDEYFEDGPHRTITNHKDGYIEVRWVPIDASLQDFEATKKRALTLLRKYSKNYVREVAPNNDSPSERDD